MTSLQDSVGRVREFNRFYTRTIGVLNETLTQSEFTLAESRVLYELGHRASPNAVDIARDLLLDPAYLARILRRFRDAGLVKAHADGEDRRRRRLELTARGRAALDALQARSEQQIEALLAPLDALHRENMVDAMARITETLQGDAEPDVPVVLRPHRPGDIGWVISREASLYTEEYGWNIEFEAMVAQICADFLRNFQPGREFCWIAERGGERLGAIFLVRQDDEVAKLRLLHVESAARGRGVGRMLVERCVQQARDSGYRRLTLWTNSILTEARRIYERVGFQLVSEEAHHSFGVDLTGQYWELEL